jgi:hypothetical protein
LINGNNMDDSSDHFFEKLKSLENKLTARHDAVEAAVAQEEKREEKIIHALHQLMKEKVDPVLKDFLKQARKAGLKTEHTEDKEGLGSHYTIMNDEPPFKLTVSFEADVNLTVIRYQVIAEPENEGMLMLYDKKISPEISETEISEPILKALEKVAQHI